MKFTTSYHFSLLLVLLVASFTAADCCYKDCGCFEDWGTQPPSYVCTACGDCSSPTPCCGNGSCNIFCCNCDGGELTTLIRAQCRADHADSVGCRGGSEQSCPSECPNQNSFSGAASTRSGQIRLNGGPTSFYDARALDNSACSYDSTFDQVDKDHSGEITLSEYLIWAGMRDKGTRSNATTVDEWIAYFYT